MINLIKFENNYYLIQYLINNFFGCDLLICGFVCVIIKTFCIAYYAYIIIYISLMFLNQKFWVKETLAITCGHSVYWNSNQYIFSNSTLYKRHIALHNFSSFCCTLSIMFHVKKKWKGNITFLFFLSVAPLGFCTFHMLKIRNFYLLN